MTEHLIEPDALGLAAPPIASLMSIEEITKTLRRHALAAAFVQLSHTEWVPDKDLFIRIFSIGQPGQLEVQLPTRSELYATAESIFLANLSKIRRLSRFIDAASLIDFLVHLRKQTVVHQRSMTQMFNETMQINNAILDEAAWTTDKLFAIKVASDVIFNGAMVLSGVGFAAGLVGGIGYSLSTQLAMTRHEAEKTDVMAFTVSAAAPVVPSATGSAVSGGLGEGLIGQAKAAFDAVRLGLAAEANSLAASRSGANVGRGWSSMDGAGPGGHRTMPKGMKLGSNGTTLQQAQKNLKSAGASAKGLGFVASMLFLKEDIVKAMNGYSSSLESAN